MFLFREREREVISKQELYKERCSFSARDIISKQELYKERQNQKKKESIRQHTNSKKDKEKGLERVQYTVCKTRVI